MLAHCMYKFTGGIYHFPHTKEKLVTKYNSTIKMENSYGKENKEDISNGKFQAEGWKNYQY